MMKSWQRIIMLLIAAGGIVCLALTRGNSSVERDGGVQETKAPETMASAAEIIFPYTLPDSGLVIEGTVSYTGAYMEDGSGDAVSNITGLMVYNPGQRMVRFGAIALEQEGCQQYFFVYCLPPGERCLILEKNRTPYEETAVTECRELTVRWEYQELYAQQLCYVGYGERLTLVNHSSKQLRHVILWYKQYDREKNCYLGGVAYSAHVFWLKEQEQRALAPEHYHAGSAKVVTIELEEE